MTIVFFAYHKCFDPLRLGGTDSFMRRVSEALLESESEISVEYIFYGSEKDSSVSISGILCKYFKKYSESIEYLEGLNFDKLYLLWMQPRHRFTFLFSSVYQKSSVGQVYKMEFFYPSTSYSLFVKKMELLLYSLRTIILFVSVRQRKGLYINGRVFHPPVPREYFSNSHVSKSKRRFSVVFLGRLDTRKGIDKVIELFEKLSSFGTFDCTIYGIHIEEDQDGVFYHNKLLSNNLISYVPVERNSYNREVDIFVSDVLKNADIFVQPYRSIESTVDTPLLILEAIAANCFILTTPLPTVIELLGDGFGILSYENFAQEAFSMLSHEGFADQLSLELERLKRKQRLLEKRMREEVLTNLLT